jgi:hypothetical protein
MVTYGNMYFHIKSKLGMAGGFYLNFIKDWTVILQLLIVLTCGDFGAIFIIFWELHLHGCFKTDSGREPIVAVALVSGQYKLRQLFSLSGRFQRRALSALTLRGNVLLRLGFFNTRLWRIGCLKE